MSDTGRLPLVLRREPFGGIVFDPFDGTLLELDDDGYAVARKVLFQGRRLLDPRKRAFARELGAALHLAPERPAREVVAAPWQSVTPTPALSGPTLVDFQITDRCAMGCPHCYAASVPQGAHVPWPDCQRVIDQAAECGVCQVAIGGGEPLVHPDLVDLLAFCHERGVVPNLTTAGVDFSPQRLAALERYCGAVGLSLEGVGAAFERTRRTGFSRFQESLAALREASVPTVIQVTLSAANFDQLEDIVGFCLTQPHLYGVIFLAYKNVGRGTRTAGNLGTLPPSQVTAGLERAFDALSPHMRVGYDCCMTPGIAGVEAASGFAAASNLEGCSATRGSVGVATSLDVLPCTFTAGYPLGNLRQQHLREIWRGAPAERFRARIERKRTTNPACSGCGKQNACRGGCPVMPLINCHRDHLGVAPRPDRATAACG